MGGGAGIGWGVRGGGMAGLAGGADCISSVRYHTPSFLRLQKLHEQPRLESE